jgi:hypothetical protein
MVVPIKPSQRAAATPSPLRIHEPLVRANGSNMSALRANEAANTDVDEAPSPVSRVPILVKTA